MTKITPEIGPSAMSWAATWPTARSAKYPVGYSIGYPVGYLIGYPVGYPVNSDKQIDR